MCDITYLPPDGEWTYEAWTRLISRQLDTNVPGGKLDKLTQMVLGSIGVASISLAFMSPNCLLCNDTCSCIDYTNHNDSYLLE